MIALNRLDKFLDKYLNFDRKLDVAKIDPIMANGLMVKGKENINQIGFGVSASLSLFHKAKKDNCDCLIVHHSFNFPQFNHYDSIFQNRIAFLINNDISLFGYHFLLDAHPEIGNNAEMLKLIKAIPIKPYYHKNDPWGWIGELEEVEEIREIVNKLAPVLSSRKIIYRDGPVKIKRVAVVSGSGAPYQEEMQDLLDEKIDLFITGEVKESNRELFREAKINFIAGGHYHTEVFGIKALMEKVKKEFPEVTVEWLDLENTV